MELARISDEFRAWRKNNTENVDSQEETGDINEDSKQSVDNSLQSGEQSFLFPYVDELSEFLDENYKEDIDNAKIKTDELLDLEMKDGQFVEDTTDENDVKFPVVGMFNDLLTDKKVKNKVDTNNDGKINKEEATEFVKTISELDGEKESISVKDMLSAAKKIDELKLNDNKVEDTSAKQYRAPSNNNYGSYKITDDSKPVTFYYNPLNNNKFMGDSSYVSATDELKNQQKTAEKDISNLSQKYKDIFTGKNSNIKQLQQKYDSAKKEYKKLLNDERNLSSEQKSKLNNAIQAVEKAVKERDEAKVKLQEAQNARFEQMRIVAKEESVLNALNTSLQNQKDDSKIKELKSKISESESKLSKEKSKLDKLTQNVNELQKNLEEKISELEKAQDEKNKLEQQIVSENEKISEELKAALKTYKEAEKNLEAAKSAEEKTAKSSLENKQNELIQTDNKINTADATKVLQGSNLNFNVDVQENLTSGQKADLENFKANFAQNRDKYEEVAKQTGVPAQLIAALHWRESNGDFTTYLHNGEKLGKPTTMVPAGIYFGENQWVEAAVDAIKSQGTSGINPNDINSLLDFAERYNGLGYRDKGIPSPYVWAGTTNYKGGKYVADGVFDPNHVDQQLGVAVMMKAIS